MMIRRTKRLRQSITVPWPPSALLVGGAVRNALLQEPTDDYDWLVTNPERAARAYHAAHGGSLFVLNEAEQHWRVLQGDVSHDFVPLPAGADMNARIYADLARRDFTVNAAALTETGEFIDPHGAAAAVRTKSLQALSEDALFNDPIRVIRAARFVAAYNFTVTAQTQRWLERVTSAVAPQFGAPERISAELTTLLLSVHPAAGVQTLDDVGALTALFPELEAARGMEQGGMHHLDVLRHSIQALAELVRIFPAAELPLRLAALLHDIGKPETFSTEHGKITFYSHAQLGADIVKRALRALRFPTRVVTHTALLIRYHMVQLPTNEREARRFVHRRREILPDLLALMVADRSAARGPLTSERQRNQYRKRIDLVLQVLSEPPPVAPLLTGTDVMRLLNLKPGPRVGEALAFVGQSRAVGDIRTVQDAEAALEHFAKRQGWLEPE